MTTKKAVEIGAITAACCILILRKWDSLQNPQFFAEDGTVFFIGARQLGLQAVLTPYGGYLHLVPRLVALAAGVFDPLWIPAVYNSSALVIDLAVISLIFSPRIKLPAKPALALATALVPHTGEVFLSLTNVQWFLALALVLLLLAGDATTVSQRWFDRFLAVFCGLTGPFSCFLSPLFVVRAAIRRTRDSFLLSILTLFVAAIQADYLYSAQGLLASTGPADPLQLISSMFERLCGTYWTGYGFAAFSHAPYFIALELALAAVATWFALHKGEWLGPKTMIASAGLCLVIPVALKFLYDARALWGTANGDRYFFLPHVLLAWLLVIACVESKGRLRLVPATLLAVSVAFNVPYLRSPPMHDYAWAKHVQPIRDGDSFEIPINPEGLEIEGRAIPTAR